MAPRAPAPRVDLQPPRAENQDEFIRAMRASRALHRPWISMPSTPEAYASYIERSAGPATAFYLVRVRADGALAGFFNLSEIVRGKLQSAFLGFGAVAGFEGRGLMSEGLELLLRHAFTTHRLHRVEANIQPGNAASAALVRRAGFTLEGFSPRYLKVGGRWCDHERWALRSESWKARRRR
jgi:ribosomal-protein-alanine N-acetyltransferase